jgi:hydroxymethylpyrimidine pyrophosphatase-like HAD family hydrolase
MAAQWTKLHNHHEINQPVVDAIKKACEAGVYVVLSTGRPLSGTRDFMMIV